MFLQSWVSPIIEDRCEEAMLSILENCTAMMRWNHFEFLHAGREGLNVVIFGILVVSLLVWVMLRSSRNST